MACCSSGGYGVRSLPSQVMVGALCEVWAASIPEMVGYSAMDECVSKYQLSVLTAGREGR